MLLCVQFTMNNYYAVRLIALDFAKANSNYDCALNADFTALSTALGGNTVSGGKMKELGVSHWNSPNTGADNSSGFTALPGGGKYLSNGACADIGAIGYYWTYDDFVAYMQSSSAVLSFLSNYATKKAGFSLRIIRRS